MNKEEFFNLCKNHDWSFQFSDDGRVYNRGLNSLKNIESVSKQDPLFEKILTGFENYYNGGKQKPTIENYE